MNDKQPIRYLGFESIARGGRALRYSVGPASNTPIEIVIDIPGGHFTGSDRILFQEAAGIGFLKVKECCEAGTIRHALHVSLTSADIGRYRQVRATSAGRKAKAWGSGAR